MAYARVVRRNGRGEGDPLAEGGYVALDGTVHRAHFVGGVEYELYSLCRRVVGFDRLTPCEPVWLFSGRAWAQGGASEKLRDAVERRCAGGDAAGGEPKPPPRVRARPRLLNAATEGA